MKVRTRMMIAFLVLGFLGFSFLLYFTNERIEPVYLKPVESDLVDTATILAAQLAEVSSDDLLGVGTFSRILSRAAENPLEARIYDYMKSSFDMVVYLTDDKGIVQFHTHGHELGKDYSGWRDVARTLSGSYGARTTWERHQGENVLYFYVAAPVKKNDHLLGVVSVGKEVMIPYAFSENIRKETMMGLVLALILALTWGFLFSAWITRPIRELTSYVEAVRDGRSANLPKLGRSDIGMLGRGFEEMRDALEGKRYVEQYVQTLTHEIKSPLSAIKGAAELLQEDMPPERRQRFLANIHTESKRIQNIVDRLLELSAIESRKMLKDPREVDLVTLCAETISSMRPAMEAKHIQLIFEDCEPLIIRGERFLLHLALSNLIGNAVEFTPQNGCITVSIGSGVIEIRDTGPGIPDYALSRVFERFYSLSRPDTGKKSSGLGLSIVRSVAELHHGQVSLANHPEGGAVARWQVM